MKNKIRIFSDSQLTTYRNCPAAGYLRYNRNLINERDKENDNLVYGEIIHDMFDMFYLTYNKTKDTKEAMKIAKQHMLKSYEESGIAHQYKTGEAAVKFLSDVVYFGLHLRGEAIPEQEFIIDLFQYKDTYIKLNGRIDLVIKTDSGLEIYDFKTVSKISASYYDKMRMSSQFLTYCYAKNTSKFSLVPLHCTKTPSACAPFSFDYNDRDRKLWFEETKSNITSILQREKNIGNFSINTLFPRNRTMCSDSYKYGCGYSSICLSGDLDTEDTEGFISYKEI